MRKTAFILLSILFFCIGFYPRNAGIAFCEALYGRAEKAGVGFYSSEVDPEPMFFIPLGYYVYITGETDDFYYCEYAKSESAYTKKYGFVKKTDIYIDGDMALPLFPEISLSAIKDTNLYSKSNTATVISSITAGQSAYFYGVFEGGDTPLYYVKISGDFGYVEASGFEQLVIPTHPKLLSFETEGVVVSPEIEEPQAENDISEKLPKTLSSDIQIAMILCIALPAIAFIFYAFKPSGGEVARYFEND